MNSRSGLNSKFMQMPFNSSTPTRYCARLIWPCWAGVCCWLLLGVLLTGCEPAAIESDPVIRMGLVQPPSSLDRRYATDAISSRLCRLIYRGLVDFDDQLMPVPDLATWQLLAADHYRFQL
ncbi:MAG: hypothetical protein JKY89_08945, partial [Immundisolibacteraceae bacterium]|nr:hypothetical protein [Immundisolibacteraceae bacterium]